MKSISDAFSGPWAASVRGWALVSALGSLVVLTQELATPLPDAGWIALSALAQAGAAGLWTLTVAGLSRRRFGRIVPVAAGLLWIGHGAARGASGALVATAAGVDPEWAYRLSFWTVLAVCWLPLLTYAYAQWQEHRRLLSLRVTLRRSIERAAQRDAESTEARTRRLVDAVESALGPATDELRASLLENATTMDADTLASIAARVDDLTVRTAAFTSPPPHEPPVAEPGVATVREASLEFELGRPIFASLLAAVATAPLLLPESFREGGWWGLAEAALAILASTIVVAGVFLVLRPSRASAAVRSVASRFGVVAAGLAGTAVLVLLPWDDVTGPDAIVVVLYPVAFALAASTVATAVALHATNVDLGASTERLRKDLVLIYARVARADEAAAARIVELVRGEINGRLAVSAMALGFLAGGDTGTRSRADVVSTVLAQLDEVAADLQRLDPS